MSIDDLPDDAVVIRGGPMTAANVIRRARKDRERLGLFGVSAFAGSSSETTVAELVERGEIPHAVLNRSTVGRIRSAGFVIRRFGRWPHCTIDLGDDADEDASARLVAAFDQPELTPRTGDPT